MTTRNDGGPAFPRTGTNFGEATSAGMSLRDWFAGMVLPKIIEIYAADNKAGIGVEHLPRNCAGHAYRIADAMLAERSRP